MSFVNFVDMVYPIGTIWVGYTSTSPASMFGGTWTRLHDCLLRATSNFTVLIEGQNNYTLTAENMPAHTHVFPAHSHSANHTHGMNHRHGMETRLITDSNYGLAYPGIGGGNGFGGRVTIKEDNQTSSILTSGPITEANASRTYTDGASFTNTATDGAHTSNAAGGGKSFSLLPEYQDVYVWERVS